MLGKWLEKEENRLAFDRQVLEVLARDGNMSAAFLSGIVGSSTDEALDALKRLEALKYASKVDDDTQILPKEEDRIWTIFS